MSNRLFLLLLASGLLATAQTTNFTATGSIQTYTVPPGVFEIQIDAAGAQGGAGGTNGGPTPLPGGPGARLLATFPVTPGEILNIVVGGQGKTSGNNGGGGGGSFVYRTPNQMGLLIGAAGGGGAGVGLAGASGSSSNTAFDGDSASTPGGTAGTGGNGGGGGGTDGGGGGGSGLLSNGGDGNAGAATGSGGKALANGANGGTGDADGGFGGGGAALFGAGGGGGYNGGGGGGGGGAVPAGGGGSFSASTPSIATDGFQSGDGYVTITAILVPTDAFQVNYASNLQAGDSFVNISNTGSSGANLCANVYVFDPSEEMVACCSCLITPNAVQSLSVQGDLISNTLSPSTPQSVVIKILASTPTGASCNPASLTIQTLEPGLRAWGTKLHALPANPVNYGVTETGFLSGGISPAELTHLTSFCGFVNANGSGFGICKSCRAGGLNGTKQ